MHENVGLLGLLTLGLLIGFGHCLGMCGPFVLYVSRRFGTPGSSRAALLRQQALYGLGRTLTYAAMGAVMGGLGQGVDMAGSIVGYQNAALVLAGSLLILYALLSLLDLAPSLSSPGGSLFARVAAAFRQRSPNNAFLTGLLLGFLPCGPVYTALIAAAALGGPVKGALGLFLFGLGTQPAMLGLSLADELLVRHRAVVNRISVVFLLAMGGYFVWQGLA